MAGSAFSAVGSPPPHGDLNPVQDWELLSASTLLAQGYGLGFGLPPLTTLGLHTSRVEDDGVSRRDSDSDAELGFIFRSGDGSSLPLDASQITVVCSTSTSTVEPFTEGWKPQFRIAGAPLQENYYAPDPFPAAASNTGTSLEPFLDMDQSFLAEPPTTMGKDSRNPSFMKQMQEFVPADCTERCIKDAVSLQQEENNEDNLASRQDEGTETCLLISENANLGNARASERSTCICHNMRIRKKSWTFFKRKSYVIWSVALTTALLGVFFITYRSQSEHNDLVHELSPGDEVCKHS